MKNQNKNKDFISKIRLNPDLLLNTFIIYNNGIIDYIFKIIYKKHPKDINFAYYIAYTNNYSKNKNDIQTSFEEIPISAILNNKLQIL